MRRFSDILALYDQQTGLLRMPRQIPYNVRKAISSVKISRERRYTVTETSRGEVERALALGLVLLGLSFAVNLALTAVQQRPR